MFKVRNIIYTILMLIIFVYGIAIGRYQIFPYQELRKLQDWIAETETKNYNLGNVDVIDSSLQRLLVKEIPIDIDYSPELYGHGGAITSLEGLIYVSTYRNDEKKEDLVVIDTRSLERIEVESLSVPMNLNELLNSPFKETKDFRVTGIYAEKTGENEHTLFVSHNEYHPDKECVTFSVSRVSVKYDNSNSGIANNWDTIFRASPCNKIKENDQGALSFGGRMSGGPVINYDHEHLLVSVGNYSRSGLSSASLAMDTTSAFGKLILLNKKTGQASIYAMGLRNSQGLFRDANNNIWATDHGPQGGDELNLIEKGENYGWPEVTYGIEYGNKPWPLNDLQGSHAGYTKPIYAWVPSIGISKIIRLDGFHKFPLWSEDLVIGSMNDKSIHRLRLDKNNQVVYSERINIGHSIRDLTKLEDDESLAILADGGTLVIIEDGGPVFEEIGPEVEARIKTLDRYEEFLNSPQTDFIRNKLATAETIFIQNCSSCHSLQKENGVGPHLNNIFSRKIGTIKDFNYSSSLSSRDEIWRPELMEDFLLKKEPFTNTLMQKVVLSESERDSVIHYLLSAAD